MKKLNGCHCVCCGDPLRGNQKKWCEKHKGQCSECGRRRMSNGVCEQCQERKAWSKLGRWPNAREMEGEMRDTYFEILMDTGGTKGGPLPIGPRWVPGKELE